MLVTCWLLRPGRYQLVALQYVFRYHSPPRSRFPLTLVMVTACPVKAAIAIATLTTCPPPSPVLPSSSTGFILSPLLIPSRVGFCGKLNLIGRSFVVEGQIKQKI